MTKVEQLENVIRERSEELEKLRSRHSSCDIADVAERRQLRNSMADAEGDIGELSDEVRRLKAWASSPERVAQVELARSEGKRAELAIAAAAAEWIELEGVLEQARSIAGRLVAKHATADAHIRAVIEAQCPLDANRRMDHHRLIAPYSRGLSSGMSHAVAGVVRDALFALPGGNQLLEQYLSPNQMTDWKDANIGTAVAVIREGFKVRLQAILSEKSA